jgi:formiminotetrahydrofolate cyclodeaminase
MSKQVTISIQGSVPYVKEVEVATVGELKSLLNMEGYTVTANLASVDDEDEVEAFKFYTFTKQVKGA